MRRHATTVLAGTLPPAVTPTNAEIHDDEGGTGGVKGRAAGGGARAAYSCTCPAMAGGAVFSPVSVSIGEAAPPAAEPPPPKPSNDQRDGGHGIMPPSRRTSTRVTKSVALGAHPALSPIR